MLTPNVGSGEDGSSATALTQEAAQKMQLLERERDNFKAERHLYQMKWLAAEDIMEAMKKDKQSLQVAGIIVRECISIYIYVYM